MEAKPPIPGPADHSLGARTQERAQEQHGPALTALATAPAPSDGHVVHHARFGHEAMKRRNFGHFHNHHNWEPTWYEILIMLVMSLLSFTVALDACVIVTSFTTIITDLGGNSTQGFWIATSYLLTHAVLMPFISSLSDIFGRPICIWISVLIFTIGTMACSRAQSITVLIIGRSVQGIGSGGIVVLSLVIFTDLVPLRHRPKWYGTVQGAWGLATAMGPIVGGVIAQKTTWRWQFYMMLPLCAIGAVALPVLFRLKPRASGILRKLLRIDWGGYLLFIASSTLFLIAVSWGGTQYEWTSITTLVPLLVGACGIFATYLYEIDIALEPWLLRQLFRNISSVTIYMCSMAQGVLLYGQLYFVALYFRSIKGSSPVMTAICLLPAILTLLPAAIITGILVTQTNNYRSFIWGGWSLLTAGSAMMAGLWDEGTSTAAWVGTLFLVGLGHGGILNAQNVATQAMCSPGDEGAAAAMYGFARHLGMALGVGVGGTTWTNFMISNLEANELPVDIAVHNLAYISQLDVQPDSSEDKQRVLRSYLVSFHGLFCVLLGISTLAFAGSFLLKHIDMNKGFNKFGKRTARSEPLRKKRINKYLRKFVGPAATLNNPQNGHAGESLLGPGPGHGHHGHHHHHHRHDAGGSSHEGGDGEEKKKAQTPAPGAAAYSPPLSPGIQTPASAFLGAAEGGLGVGVVAGASRSPLPTFLTGATLVPDMACRPMDAVVEEPDEELLEETEEEMVERLEREHVLQQDAILNSNPSSSTRSMFSSIMQSPFAGNILRSPVPNNEPGRNEGGGSQQQDAVVNSSPPSSTRSVFSNIHSPFVRSILRSPMPSNEPGRNEGGGGRQQDAVVNSSPPSSTRSAFNNIHSPFVNSILRSPMPNNKPGRNEGGGGRQQDAVFNSSPPSSTRSAFNNMYSPFVNSILRSPMPNNKPSSDEGGGQQ